MLAVAFIGRDADAEHYRKQCDGEAVVASGHGFGERLEVALDKLLIYRANMDNDEAYAAMRECREIARQIKSCPMEAAAAQEASSAATSFKEKP